MKLSQLKEILKNSDTIDFQLSSGEMVPSHFHVTEIGNINKKFIDCGGAIRSERKISFQLWQAGDYDHRLGAQKLLKIITLSEKELNLADAEIEVEYQGNTIGKYGLDYNGKTFLLTETHTDCLAKDNCGVPTEKPKVRLSALKGNKSCCAPGSGCC